VVGQFRVLALPDAGTGKNGGDAIARVVIVLVPGQDQQAVVLFGPLDVTVEPVL